MPSATFWFSGTCLNSFNLTSSRHLFVLKACTDPSLWAVEDSRLPLRSSRTNGEEDAQSSAYNSSATFSLPHVRLAQDSTGIFKPLKSQPGSPPRPKLLDPGLASYPLPCANPTQGGLCP